MLRLALLLLIGCPANETVPPSTTPPSTTPPSATPPPSGQSTAASIPPELAADLAPLQLEGEARRKIWLVNGNEADKARLEALGLIVELDMDRPGAARRELVVWCDEIPHRSAEALLRLLGLPLQSEDSAHGYVLRTHANTPYTAEEQAAKNEECGEFYEITLRYDYPDPP